MIPFLNGTDKKIAISYRHFLKGNKSIDQTREMLHNYQYGKTTITYQVRFADRKSLQINVHPNKSVETIAPIGTSLQDIEKKVEKRARWILEQQRFFNTFLPRTPPRQYISGETHNYLGKQYLLKTRASKTKQIEIQQNCLMVYTPTPKDPITVKKIVETWYLSNAEEWFTRLLQETYPLFAREKITYPILKIKRMAHRWGSCTATNKIVLHPDIIQAPLICIRYVLIHELCHLVVPYHNKAFYRLLDSKMPDWRRWKGRLDLGMV